ncbi:cupin domain-containing protein [Chloroflexota bacterium]
MKLIRIEDLPTVVPPNHYDLFVRRIVDVSIGAKAMIASLVRMEPTGRVDPHTHDKEVHLFIVLKGEMAMKTAQGEVRVKQGEAAFIYPGEVHENCNVAEGETEYIVIRSALIP